VCWQKFETDAGDTVSDCKSVCAVVNQLNFDKASVKLSNDNPSVFHEAVAHRQIAHEAAHATSFQSKKVRGNAVVSEH
jgi:hypothetical protein